MIDRHTEIDRKVHKGRKGVTELKGVIKTDRQKTLYIRATILKDR